MHWDARTTVLASILKTVFLWHPFPDGFAAFPEVDEAISSGLGLLQDTIADTTDLSDLLGRAVTSGGCANAVSSL